MLVEVEGPESSTLREAKLEVSLALAYELDDSRFELVKVGPAVHCRLPETPPYDLPPEH